MVAALRKKGKHRQPFWSDAAKRAFFACLITAASAAAVWLLFGIRYQTNDDATLANIAAGAYGDRLHMVYVNVLFAALLRPLYLLAQANWYVIVQLILMLAAAAATLYLLMDKMGVLVGGMAGAAIMVAFAEHIFYSFQYTECSFILLTAGLLLITHNLGSFNKGTALGIVLALAGSLVRWSGFYAVGALSAPLLLYAFFVLDKEKKRKAVVTMVILFVAVLGAKAADTLFYKADPAWEEYTRYNAARTQYSDFKVYDLPEENPFADKGISDIDYKMLRIWDFYDEERFDTPLLKELSEGGREIGALQLIGETLRCIRQMLSGQSYHYAFLLAGIISLLCLRMKPQTLPLIGMYGVFGVLILYLTYKMRFPAWVESGILWTTVVFALYCVAGIVKTECKRCKAVTAAALLLLLCISFPSYRLLYSDVPNYKQYGESEAHYIAAMSEDKENLYLLSTTAINVAAGFDVMDPHSDGFYSNIVAYGGWLSRAPHRDEALQSYGLYRPLVDAVDKANVYLGYHNIQWVEMYVEQELGREIDVIPSGENAFAPYQLVTALPKE